VALGNQNVQPKSTGALGKGEGGKRGQMCFVPDCSRGYVPVAGDCHCAIKGYIATSSHGKSLTSRPAIHSLNGRLTLGGRNTQRRETAEGD